MSEVQAESLIQSTESAPEPSQEQMSSFSALIPDDMKDDPSITKFKDMSGFLKSYKELEKSFGRRVEIPDPSNDEAVLKVLNRLGRPEAPDKYELSLSDEQKALFNPEDPINQEFLKSVHAAGLTNKQANSIIHEYVTRETKAHQSRVEEAALVKQKLSEQWGAENYNQKIEAINSLLSKYEEQHGKETMHQLYKEFGRNPALISMLDDLAMSQSGKESVSVSDGGKSFGMDVATAKNRASELRKALNDMKERDPGRQALLNELNTVYNVLDNAGALNNRR